jgi:putative peptide zinc metalloprotease protein
VSPAFRASRLISAAPREKGVAQLAARHGPASDRPALRFNLVIRQVVQMGEAYWVVKNPETMKYYSFDEGTWGLIRLFDGTRTVREIHEAYQARFPRDTIEASLVLEYEEMLRKMELLEQSVAERNLQVLAQLRDARRLTAERKAEGSDIFMIPFHVVDPNRFLDRTQKYVRWIWSPPVVLGSLVFVAITAGVIARHFGPIWTETLELYAFLRKPFWDAVQFFVILTFIGAIHELAHGYVCKFYGGEVHDIGVALLYFMPAFYCDTTDALLFPNKWHRLWVILAGMYIEAIICCAATGLWVASYPDTLLHELAYKLMLFTGISTIFFNINPLRKIDGYYALTSVIEIPELREDSFEYLGALLKRHVLRLNVEVPVLSRRKRRIFLIYAPLAIAFLVLIMLFIGGLFYNFYARYFPNVAIVLLALTLLRIFRKPVRGVLQTIKLLYLDKKEWLMSRRVRVFLLGGAVALLLILGVPWARWTIGAGAVLKPVTQVLLEAPEDGTIVGVRVQEGDLVQAGQVVAFLSSPQVDSGVAGRTAEREGLRKQASGRREMADAVGLFESEQREAAVEATLRGEEERRRRLAVPSPITGRVLTPRMQDLPGRYVSAGSPIAVIGDCRVLKAEIPVSERFLAYLRRGSPVSLQLRARPARILHGSIVRISPAAENLPRTADGSRQVIRPSERPERFVAVVHFENAGAGNLPGMTGRAKISLQKRASYLWRGGRVLRDWLQTVIWW